MIDALNWAGTFHGIGARLLREYADRIGLNRAFTIHDREDSADLMILSGTSAASRRPKTVFPPRHVSIYSRCVNAKPNWSNLPGTFYNWTLRGGLRSIREYTWTFDNHYFEKVK